VGFRRHAFQIQIWCQSTRRRRPHLRWLPPPAGGRCTLNPHRYARRIAPPLGVTYEFLRPPKIPARTDYRDFRRLPRLTSTPRVRGGYYPHFRTTCIGSRRRESGGCSWPHRVVASTRAGRIDDNGVQLAIGPKSGSSVIAISARQKELSAQDRKGPMDLCLAMTCQGAGA
jgi:hypothetical protein